ncbi:MAG: protein translocase subunit SecD [Candidatus Colwellbacteria bacterium]|nr:protein translocase subunit SecD [Candidatus Colwellbacteria bacterium]
MKSRQASQFILITIIFVTVLAALFVSPKPIGEKFLPWRLGLDLIGGSSVVYEVDLTGIPQGERDEAVAGLREVIERRVNLYGVAEPKVAVAKRGDTYQLLVDLAGVKDTEGAINQIGATPILDFREEIRENDEVNYSPTTLTGRYLTKATLGFDNLNRPIVNFEFNDEGTELFRQITARNVGKPLAVFVDNNLLQEPIVQQEINGPAQITFGTNTSQDQVLQEAKILVERFNAGALSAPIKQIHQRTISPTAAEDALKSIIVAGLAGALVVMLFMISYYRRMGIFAAFALIIYTILTLAVFKIIPNFTMTLAGIAGFVLSIGMAVDANILIFERTKEELKKGLTKIAATEEGFRRAWPSIRDSNAATIITAIILWFLTSSFVKGFALTLGLGVMVSMFSAIFVTRTMLRVFTKES